MSSSDESIQTVQNVLSYFRQELRDALTEIDVSASEPTEAYLVHLLDGFTRIEPSSAEKVGFDKPAALLLGEAMNAPGEQRIEAFRRLGDASLFNCGFFAGYLSRRLVDSEYYQDVGRLSYQKLTQLMSLKDSSEMFRTIYDELSSNFEGVVEAFQRLGRSLHADDVELSADAIERAREHASASTKSLQAAGDMLSGDLSDD